MRCDPRFPKASSRPTLGCYCKHYCQGYKHNVNRPMKKASFRPTGIGTSNRKT